MKAYVGGVNGSGKSTVLQVVSEAGYTVIHATGEFMLYLNFGNDYEQLRALPDAVRDTRLAQFMEQLLAKKESFLLDSHYLNLVRGRTSKVVGNWIQGFDALILISAPVEALWNRTTKDATWRDRALFPEGIEESKAKEILAHYQKDTQREFRELARRFNLPSLEVHNEENEAPKAAQQIIDFISKF